MIALLWKWTEIFEKKRCCVTQLWYTYMQYHFNGVHCLPSFQKVEPVNDAESSKNKKRYKGNCL